MQTAAVSLVILAGGLGSRFGGDKQLATVGDTGRTLLHFSVLDAYAAGIRHLVLLIRDNLQDAVKTQILAHLPADLRVDLCFQRLSDIPAGATLPASERQKPWGTTHALWCARHALPQPFIVINADDYYGAEAMQLLVSHFRQATTDWAMVAYPLAATLSEHGGVNRGICRLQPASADASALWLQQVSECSAIVRTPDGQLQGRLAESTPCTLSDDLLVSMNIWGFTPAIFDRLTDQLQTFFASAPQPGAEAYLPAAVDEALAAGQQLRIYVSAEQWAGVTYPADLPRLAEFFNNKNQRFAAKDSE